MVKHSTRKTGYVPDRGDLVWLDFDPQAGHEQGGRRPALILSPREYNAKSLLVLACPITAHSKGYPFEVELPKSYPVTGVILADHVKSFDWKARKASFAAKATLAVLEEAQERLRPLLGY